MKDFTTDDRNIATSNHIVDRMVHALNGKRKGDQWLCHCPAHDDENPSLGVKLSNDGQILVKCYRGCTQASVISALRIRGLWPTTHDRIHQSTNTTEYIYMNRDLQPALKVARNEHPAGKKKFLQSHLEDGRWVFGGFKGDLLPFKIEDWPEDKAEPIFHVEGEKCALALMERGLSATTTPGGASGWKDSFAHAYRDRTVVIIPDNDNPGLNYANEVLQGIKAIAKSVKLIFLPGLADGEDIYDWFEQKSNTVDKLREILADSPDTPGAHGGGDEFTCDDSGVFAILPKRNKIKICSKIVVACSLRDYKSQSWSRELIITDPDGVNHLWVMPMAQLAADASAVIEKLLDYGAILEPGPKNRLLLLQYLQTSPALKSRCTKRLGWNENTFVYPDVSYQASGLEPVRFLSESAIDHRFYANGTLDEWRSAVAAPCIGHSRLVFALSAAFAAPLLEVIGEESFGLNIFGSSSKGKTTLLYVAGSVFGGGQRGKYVRSWRATGNGLESVAAVHNSSLLCLDEMGQVDAREVGEIAYMIGNGSGKIRGTRLGESRTPHAWRLIYLSTGEVTLRNHMSAVGKRAKTGQEIRLIEIPIEPLRQPNMPGPLGNFHSLAALSDHLRDSSLRFFGTPSREFLKALAAQRDNIVPDLNQIIEKFSFGAKEESSQVARVVKKFGLIAAAGELAVALGVLPFDEGECLSATRECYRDWREGWGSGDRESSVALNQIRDFLNCHGESRFVATDVGGDRVDMRSTIYNKAGYRHMGTDKNGKTCLLQWWIYTTAFAEMISGCDHSTVIKLLTTKGLLVRGTDAPAAQRRDPMTGENQRFYILKAESTEENSDAV